MPSQQKHQRELEICRAYETAFNLLLLITDCDSKGEKLYASTFARFLADLALQPKHRVVCMRMAITKNMQIQNYGIAAKYIRVKNKKKKSFNNNNKKSANELIIFFLLLDIYFIYFILFYFF